MTPLDLSEWAQSLRTASDSQVADFAGEVLDLIDLEPEAMRFRALVEALEKATDEKIEPRDPDDIPWRWGEKIEALVKASEDQKEAAKLAYENRLERAGKINRAEMSPKLEYDL